MKKILSTLTSLIIIAGMMYLTSCKKDDTTAPTLSLKGNASVTIDLGDKFTDPGYTANDDKDGDISSKVKVSGLPENTNVAGAYTLTYSVEDAAGNTATQATRTLYIKTDKLIGQYDVKESNNLDTSTTAYNLTVTQSSSAYNKLVIANFGGYGPNIIINATVDKAVINIPSQTFTVDGIAYTVSGTGGTYDGATFKLLTIKYNSKWTDGGNSYNYDFTATIQKKY